MKKTLIVAIVILIVASCNDSSTDFDLPEVQAKPVKDTVKISSTLKK